MTSDLKSKEKKNTPANKAVKAKSEAAGGLRSGDSAAKLNSAAKKKTAVKTVSKAKVDASSPSKVKSVSKAYGVVGAKVKASPKTKTAGAAKVSSSGAKAKPSVVKAVSAAKPKKVAPSSRTKAEVPTEKLSAPKAAKALVAVKAAVVSKAKSSVAASKKSGSLKPVGRELAELVAAAAGEHKPINPVLLDLSALSSVADWFFIASAENPRQMTAIAEKIIRRARDRGIRPLGHEGLGRGEGHWVLVDLGDVVVHIFNLEARELYDLEGLWTDAPRNQVKV